MGKPKPLPSLARLKELFDFDPVKFFIYKVSRGTRKIGDVAGYLRSTGYWLIAIDGEEYKRNRLAWLWFTGEDPGEFEVDHKNNIRHDDCFSNLQLLSHSDNMKKNLKPKNNTSGYTGVYWIKRDKKWSAQIKHNYRSIHLGYYTNAEDAARAYDAKARELS